MFTFVIALGLCLSYIALYFLLPKTLEQKSAPISHKSILSFVLIFFLSLITYKIAYNISDPELGNRFLHAIGGGFLSLVVCFLAVKDSKIIISRFQFFILSILIATTLGVGNEIMEFLLQKYANMEFARTINDTWLDLVSNTLGALLGSLCSLPFLRKTT